MKKGVLSFILLCSVASSLAAQGSRYTPNGSRIEYAKPAPNVEDRRLTSEEQGRKLLADYARCFVDARPKVVAEVFGLDFDASAAALQNAKRQETANNSCLADGKFRVKMMLFRSTLYSEMYRRYAKGNSDVASRFRALPYDPAAPISADISTDARVNALLLQLAACAYARQPDAVRGVVTQKAGTSAQSEAFAKVIPDLGPCVQQDEKLVLSKAVLENAFGEYLYRSQMSGATASIGKTQ